MGVENNYQFDKICKIALNFVIDFKIKHETDEIELIETTVLIYNNSSFIGLSHFNFIIIKVFF